MRRLVLILTFLPAALFGQQLGGVVRDSATRAPLPGAVVNALDSASKPVARAITDAAGRWSIPSAPGAKRLHLIRIGFRPVDVPLLSPSSTSLELVMGRIPPMLEALKVAASELCPGSADRGAAFQLWEQARDGLLATVVARELKPARATTLMFESGLSPGDEIVRRQRKEVKTGQTTRPFLASAPPSFFAEHGYMSEDASGRVYNAPDADVLLDESFATTHCFHLQKADAAHVNQIGLAFTPIRGRDTLVDVKGTVWIDEKQPQVRSLDFVYTSLERPATDMQSGGHIEFRTMENGVAFIERWNLRLPSMQQLPTFNAARSATLARTESNGVIRRTDRSDLRLVEVVDAGGIVIDAEWPDGARWRDTPSLIRGLVAQKGSTDPVRGAIISIGGAGDSTLTDSTGEFELAVIPGKYMVSASDTVLTVFVATRSQTKLVDAPRAAVSPIQFELPALTGVVDEVCRGQKVRKGTAMLLGRLTVEGGVSPPRDARIEAKWQADYSQVGSTKGVTITEAQQDVTPDDGGRFVVCGVARERPIQLAYFRRDTKFADTTLKIFNTSYGTEVAWTVPRDRPVIASVSPAAVRVMDTVRATASRYASPALRAFDERSQRGQGQYIVDAVLRANESRRLPDVLMANLPGLHILNVESQAIALAARDDRGPKAGVLGRPTRLQGSGAPIEGCAVAIYMDGLPLFNPDDAGGSPPDLNQFRVARLAGVEFYAGPSGLPAPYRASACGTLLLWSKE